MLFRQALCYADHIILCQYCFHWELSLQWFDLHDIKSVSFCILHRYVTTVKVMQVGQFERLTLLFPPGVIGPQTSAQVLSPRMENPLYSDIFCKKNGCAEVWCHSTCKLLPVTFCIDKIIFQNISIIMTSSSVKDLGHFLLGYIRIMLISWDTCHRVLT